jgi:hypothetical protein
MFQIKNTITSPFHDLNFIIKALQQKHCSLDFENNFLCVVSIS